MKRNLILLATIVISAFILMLLYNLSLKDNVRIVSKKNTLLDRGFENYFETKVKTENKHSTTKDMLDKNMDNGKKVNSEYFTQNVFKHVDAILTDLQIQSESPSLPQDSEIKKMDGFDYIEFDLVVSNCSFEKFGKFVNRLEKSDKIFIIDRFEFENAINIGIRKAQKNDGIFPGKDITMKIWAINLHKSKSSNIDNNNTEGTK